MAAYLSRVPLSRVPLSRVSLSRVPLPLSFSFQHRECNADMQSHVVCREKVEKRPSKGVIDTRVRK